jgi:hypothetical protein
MRGTLVFTNRSLPQRWRVSRWRRLLFGGLYLGYALGLWRLQAVLADSCEPDCSRATWRFLATDPTVERLALLASVGYLLVLLALAACAAAVVWGRACGRRGLWLAALLLLLGLVDLKLLAYW